MADVARAAAATVPAGIVPTGGAGATVPTSDRPEGALAGGRVSGVITGTLEVGRSFGRDEGLGTEGLGAEGFRAEGFGLGGDEVLWPVEPVEGLVPPLVPGVVTGAGVERSDPAPEPVDPVEPPVEDPVPGLVPVPVAEPFEDPVPELVPDPVDEPVAAPVVEPVAEPASPGRGSFGRSPPEGRGGLVSAESTARAP